jgi:putative sigma-54 modulation protein
MRIDLTGRRLDVSPEIRTYTEEKIGKLGRLAHDLDIHVTLAAEKHRCSCTVVAQGKGATYTAEVTEDDLHKAIVEAVDVLARQLRKDKTSRLSGRRNGAATIRRPAAAELKK